MRNDVAVVRVVDDVRQKTVSEEAEPALYSSMSQIRPPVAEDRLSVTSDGQVQLTLRPSKSCGPQRPEIVSAIASLREALSPRILPGRLEEVVVMPDDRRY